MIVGAGLSGVAAAYHLQQRCPKKTYTMLEARERIGGTWDLFRYPGIRSDSDMYTLGYSFRPWTNPKAIADGPSILQYVCDTAAAYGIDQKIRFGHRVTSACWSSKDARWTLSVVLASGESTTVTCNFLFSCSGYYDYSAGFTPELAGIERFKGRVVHPQNWTDDVAYEGKRVVVIGSGATAVTLVPELAKKAAHVTMLQRSPSYVLSAPESDVVANWLRDRLPVDTAYAITRWKNVLISMVLYNYCRKLPAKAKKILIDRAKRALGESYDVERHFTPSYNPWDQRLCIVPDGDLFASIKSGRATVVTDHIETFTEHGIRLRSGEELAADLIVTATGLQLKFLGGVALEVDGEQIVPAQTMTYKGMMGTGLPNLAVAIGYTNASWTLKCELTCEYVCRLLNYMDQHHYASCVPVRDPSVAEEPLLDFSSSYVTRSISQFPKQGITHPWKLYQNYVLDLFTFRHTKIADGALVFTRVAGARPRVDLATPTDSA